MPVRIELIARMRFEFHVSFFFFFLKNMNSNSTIHAHGFTVQETKCTVHRTYNHFILKKNILKMGPTTLFTHLKIILLQCFQFSVFSKISCIRTNPTYFENLTIDNIFFIFLAHVSFCDNRILFTIWCINLLFIHNFNLQKLAT